MRIVLFIFLTTATLVPLGASADDELFPGRIVPSTGSCSTLIPIVITGEKAMAFSDEISRLPTETRLASYDARAMLAAHGTDAAIYLAVWAWEESHWKFAVRMTDGWLSDRDIRIDLVRAAFALHLGEERRKRVRLPDPNLAANDIDEKAEAGHYGEVSEHEWRWLGDLAIALDDHPLAERAYLNAISVGEGEHRNAGLNICTNRIPREAVADQGNGHSVAFLDLKLDTDASGRPINLEITGSRGKKTWTAEAVADLPSMRFRPELSDDQLVDNDGIQVRLVIRGNCEAYFSLDEPLPEKHQLLCQRYTADDLAMRRLFPEGLENYPFRFR